MKLESLIYLFILFYPLPFILTGAVAGGLMTSLAVQRKLEVAESEEGLQFGEAGSSWVYDAGYREGVAHAPS